MSSISALLEEHLDNPIKARITLEVLLRELIDDFDNYLNEFSSCTGKRCVEIAKEAANHISADVWYLLTRFTGKELDKRVGVKTREVEDFLKDVVYEAARVLEVKSYELAEFNENLSRALYYIVEALYLALEVALSKTEATEGMRKVVLLFFASYAYVNSLKDVAEGILREVYDEESLRGSEMLYRFGTILHGLRKIGITLTHEDLGRE